MRDSYAGMMLRRVFFCKEKMGVAQDVLFFTILHNTVLQGRNGSVPCHSRLFAANLQIFHNTHSATPSSDPRSTTVRKGTIFSPISAVNTVLQASTLEDGISFVVGEFLVSR